MNKDDGNFDALETLARAELTRVARDLAEQREPVSTISAGSSLALLVAARDAQLWAVIDSEGFAHE